MKNFQLIILGLLISSLSFSQTYVSGTVEGETWDVAGSPYIMEGDLFIAELTIEPGVNILASGNFTFEVGGLLTAIGTLLDSITFATTDTITGWQGILFNVTTFPSILRYCKIEHATNSGVRIINSNPTIEHCSFINNSAAQGGAIYLYNNTGIGNELNLSHCSFVSNTSMGNAGAMYVSLDDGHIILTHSMFKANLSNPLQSSGNYVGGGIYLDSGNATILSCSFVGNRSDSRCVNTFGCDVIARGGAIFFGSNTNVVVMRNNVFLQNQAHAQNDGGWFFGGSSTSYGASIYVDAGNVDIYNNVFAYNLNTFSDCGPSAAGGGVFVNDGNVTITNSTIAYNLHADGVYSQVNTVEIVNSIVFFNNNEESQIGGNCITTYSNIQNGFTGEGNISNNPVFIANDSTLHLTSISPCVDAGNPEETYNDVCFPPSHGIERNDMGAYGGPDACNWNEISSDTDFLSFNLGTPPQIGEAEIDLSIHTIFIEVDSGANLSNLVATFTLSSGAIATVGGLEQISGVTANDFSDTLIYLVTAEDGITTQDWIIIVTTSTDIFEFYNPVVCIYPNPIRKNAAIAFPNPSHSNYTLSVFNTSGSKVFEMQNIQSEKIEFDRGSLPGGVYLIELKGEKIYRGKMIIE
jgi:hypothetical protein